MGINKDSWNKIPPDIQQMFTDLLEPAARVGHELYEGTGEKRMAKHLASGEITVTKPTPEDVAYVTKIAKETVWKEWVDKMNARGLPGQKALDTYLSALEKWEKKSPFN